MKKLVTLSIPERLTQEAATLEIEPEEYVSMLITKDLVRLKNLDRIRPAERKRAEVGRPRLSARTKAVRELKGKLEGIYLKRQELMGGTLPGELLEQLEQIRLAAEAEELEKLQRIEKLQPWTKGGGRDVDHTMPRMSACVPRNGDVGAGDERYSVSAMPDADAGGHKTSFDGGCTATTTDGATAVCAGKRIRQVTNYSGQPSAAITSGQANETLSQDQPECVSGAGEAEGSEGAGGGEAGEGGDQDPVGRDAR